VAKFDGAGTIYKDSGFTERATGAFKIASGEFVVSRKQVLETTSQAGGSMLEVSSIKWVPNKFEVVELDDNYLILRIDKTNRDNLNMIFTTNGGHTITAGWFGTTARYKGREFVRQLDGWYSEGRKVIFDTARGFILE